MNNDWFSGPFQAPVQTKAPTQTAAPKKSGGLGGLLSSIAHPFVELGSAAAHVPQVVYRELQNKPIDDIQKKVFGTNNQGDIAKKIVGDTLQVGTTVAAPAAKVGFLGNLAQGAKLGAVGGAGSALSNNQDLTTGITEGAISGGTVGGAAGILGKLAGGTSRLAANRAVSQAEKGQNAERVALESEFKNVPKGSRQNLDLQGTMQQLQSLGIQPTKANMKSFSNIVTGDNGTVSGTVRHILGNVGQVSTGGVGDATRQALIREAGQLGNVEERSSAANGVLRSIRNTLQGVAMKGKGSLTDSADANDVFDAVKKLEGRVQELGGTTAAGSNGAEARAFKAAADHLKQSLAGESDQAVRAYALEPDDVEAIHKAVAKAGGSAEVGDYIVNGINNARSLDELRGIQRPFVNASKLSNEADLAQGGTLTPEMKHNTSAVDEATNIGTNLLLGNHFGVAQNTGRLAQKTGVFDKIVGGANRAVGATSGATSDIAPRAAVGAGIVAGSQPAEDNSPDAINEAASQLSTRLSTPVQPSTQPSAPQGLDQNTLLALVAADPKNAGTYISLFNALKPAQPSQTQRTAANAAANAKSALSTIESGFNEAGGGQGKIGGTIANIGGKLGINSGAATYNDTAAAMAAQIYKALGNTGTISDQDQKMIERLIPRTTDTDETAQHKLQQLSGLLEQAQTNAGIAQ